MTLTGFLAYSGALAIAAAIPGPGVTALVARALGSGFRSSLAMSLGLILGDLTYLTAVVLGLAFVAQTFGMVFLVDQMAGRRLSRLACLEILDERHHAGNDRGEEGQGRAGVELPRRPGADARQPQDDDLLSGDHADGRRPARDHARPTTASWRRSPCWC